jgi:hypothetical protein
MRCVMTRSRRRLALSGICGMICLAVAGPLAAEDMFDGVYTGKRVLTKGSGPQCPAEDDVSVTIHGETLTFTNSALKNFLLPFNPHQDGIIQPDRCRRWGRHCDYSGSHNWWCSGR